MKTALSLILLFTATLCGAQTKVIAHKSHSGSAHSFTKAYKQGLFNMAHYNFGLPNTAKLTILDKVIAINDSVTVLQKRESKVCQRPGADFSKMEDSDFTTVTDTVVNHKLFTKKNRVSFIKSSRAYTGFANSLKTVEFVGFRK